MKLNTFLYYLMILIVVGSVFYLVYYTKSQGFQCQSKPFQYAVSTLSSSTQDIITCSCSFPRSTEILTFTKDNISISNYMNLSLNITG